MGLLLMTAVFLVFAVVPAVLMNRCAHRFGQVCEGLAWGLVLLSAAAVVLAVSSADPVSYACTLKISVLLGVRLDNLSITLLVLVALLGAVILRYSRNYLAGNPQQGYFFKWMVFTQGAVSGFVIAPGLVQFFLAWLLLSLGLHKLLLFFPDRRGTLLASRKKFIISRVGDFCLLAAFWGVIGIFGTQDFADIFARLAEPEIAAAWSNANWVGWLLVLGALLKSAQFPFHTWLPDTMGAPTPVSALMHAGIINAGGFLVVRLSPLLVEMPAALLSLAVVGTITTLLAATVMMTQTSVKRALAYSTIAQMGFMFLQCGLGAFHLAVLHIVAHSLYKGHAFLATGSAVRQIKGVHTQHAHAERLTLSRVTLFLCAAFIIVFGFGALLQSYMPMPPKPGSLVFTVILALAVSHLMLKYVQIRQSVFRYGMAMILGVSCAGLYGLLAHGVRKLLIAELPQFAGHAGGVEIGFALVLGLFMAITLIVQNSRPPLFASGWTRSLYVHALNGFYLNSLVNRALRAIGIVPGKH